MDKERARRLFLAAFFLFALANGLSGSIISNYFKDVFQVDSVQRGLLEIPRELPGVVGVFVIAALPSLGNVSLSVLGFALYCVGLLVLGLFSPGYFVMQLFVFTYSLGDHMVMPIRDAIAMDLADEGRTGAFLGKYRGMMTLGSMLASVLVFVGFRVGFFYFRAGVIPSFCAALVFLSVALVLLCRLRRELPALDVRKRSGERRGLPVRRKYRPITSSPPSTAFRSGCALSLLPGSSSSFSRWARTRWRCSASPPISAVAGSPRSSENF